METSETARLMVYLRRDLYKRLMQHCLDKGVKASPLVVKLIREHLEKQKRG